MPKEFPLMISGSLPEINYFARTVSYGKEFDMVKSSLDYISDLFPVKGTNKHAIFIEPLIETGYPDIVLVEYRPDDFADWSRSRNSFTNFDLKIMFEIMKRKNVSIFSLEGLLGYKPSDLMKSIGLLEESNVIVFKNNQISLNTICTTGIHKIISVEAKIDKWSAAIDQAITNTRFATESYVMLNKDKFNDQIKSKFDEFGVGIITVNGHVKKAKASKRVKFPASYTSLLFNEWIGRYIF